MQNNTLYIKKHNTRRICGHYVNVPQPQTLCKYTCRYTAYVTFPELKC